MDEVLDYATPRPRPLGLRPQCLLATTLVTATAGGILTVYAAADGANDYLGTLLGCATGRPDARRQLLVLAPLAASLPASAWSLARQIRVGVLYCRCSTLAAMAAWVTACAIAFRWDRWL